MHDAADNPMRLTVRVSTRVIGLLSGVIPDNQRAETWVSPFKRQRDPRTHGGGRGAVVGTMRGGCLLKLLAPAGPDAGLTSSVQFTGTRRTRHTHVTYVFAETNFRGHGLTTISVYHTILRATTRQLEEEA